MLIALSAEQAVETIHWHFEVKEAQEAIGGELALNVHAALRRVDLSPCMERKLDQIADLIGKAGSNGRLPPIGDIGFPPSDTIVVGTEANVLNGQIASHMSSDQRRPCH